MRIFALVLLSAAMLGHAQAIALPFPEGAAHRRVLSRRSRLTSALDEERAADEYGDADGDGMMRRAWDAANGDGYWNAVKAIIQAAATTTTASEDSTTSTAVIQDLVLQSGTTSALPVITEVITSFVYQTITRTHDYTEDRVESSSSSSSASATVAKTSARSPSTSTSTSNTISASASTSASTTSSTTSSTSTSSAAVATTTATSPSTSLNGKMVFAHFMVGIVQPYVQSDWESDMQLAQKYGIDGFALNIGTDSYTDQQLGNAYAAAANVGFKVFISFDFSYYNDGMVSEISAIVSKYAEQSAQYTVNGAAYISTFIGDGFPWDQVAAATGKQLFVVPNWQAGSAGDFSSTGISGLFSWLAWPSANNAPINALMSTVGSTYDEQYLAVTQPASKTYMAPVSPWFSTHFASKNYIFLAETLWYDRWTDILANQNSMEVLEIVSWNDFGESHYVGPYDTPHTDDGSSQWAAGMPHVPLLDFAKPYISAFKSGASTPVVTKDMLIYWYRPTLKDVSCDGTDTVHGKPTGYELMTDTVFVVAFTTSPGQVTVTSGSNAPYVQAVQSGVTMIQVPMAAGSQTFALTTVLGSNLAGPGGLEVVGNCWNGTEYNYNIYTGTISG